MTDDQTAAELADARAHLAAMEEKCRAFLVAREPADLKGTPEQCGPAVTAEALEKHHARAVGIARAEHAPHTMRPAAKGRC